MSESESNNKQRKRIRVQLPGAPSSEEIEPEATVAEFPPADHLMFAGETYCRNHPHSLAQFLCRKCRRYFCDLCVSSRPVEGVIEHFCRLCGQACQPVATAIAPKVEVPFIKLALEAFRYPFKGGGAFLVFTGTFFLVLLKLLLWVVSHAMCLGLIASIIIVVLGGGYFFAFVKSVVLTSAQGRDELPDWPDFSDIPGEVVMPFVQNLILLLFCLGPGLVLLGYGQVKGDSTLMFGGGALLFLGFCYLPMGLLAISMFDSVAGLNPVLGIPSIAKTLGHYVITLVVFFSIVAVGAGLEYLFEEVFHIPILAAVLMGFFNFYAMMVLARTLGVLHRSNEQALGWFNRRGR